MSKQNKKSAKSKKQSLPVASTPPQSPPSLLRKKITKTEENNMSIESLKQSAKKGSLEESINYVKKLLMIGISGIAYLRTIMPASDFIGRSYEGQNIMILGKKDTSKDCAKLRTWMNGAYEALDKKYLKSLTLSIYEDDEKPECPLETYEFKIEFKEDEASLKLNIGAQEIKLNTMRLLREIYFLTPSFSRLPDSYCVTMRLLYNEDITPVDYEPTGFKPCSFDEFFFKNRRTKEMGQVNIKWISFNLEVNIEEDFIERDDLFTTKNEVVDAILITSEETSKKNKAKFENKQDKKENAETSILRDKNLAEKIDKLSVNESIVPDAKNHESIGEKKILKCDCGKNDSFKNSGILIQCKNCFTWQHSICYRLLFEDDEALDFWFKENNSHMCVECCVKYPREVPQTMDLLLLKANYLSKPMLCVLRQIVYYCYKNANSTITSDKLMKRFQLTEQLAKKILTKLVMMEVVTIIHQDKGWAKVNEKLSQKISKLFMNPLIKTIDLNGQSDQFSAMFNTSLLNSTQNTFDHLKNIEDEDTTIITDSPSNSPRNTSINTHHYVATRRSRSKSPQTLQNVSKKRVKSSDAMDRIKK